jgi:multimeric flavodoxin WrbA
MSIGIIYHSGFGHTQIVAQNIRDGALAISSDISLFTVQQAMQQMENLHTMQTLIFGCPTYMGSVSAQFKEFMEATGAFWYAQKWKNKFAAGFTNSSTVNGDKLSTLQQLAIFAAQHSMLWIPCGIMPVFKDNIQQESPNGMASYLGLMTLSDNALNPPNPPRGLETAQLFGRRIAQITKQYSHL